MKSIMEKYEIINLMKKGMSFREISRQTGINRKTVSRICNKYIKASVLLENENEKNYDLVKMQEIIVCGTSYDSSKRTKNKYSENIDRRIDELLDLEEIKKIDLGPNKQYLTQTRIHQILINEGFDISLATVSNHVREKKGKHSNTYIRQEYEYGERLEYDFGEVKLLINDIRETFYIAVLSSPKTDFRWAYLYKNQDKNVFMDSQVKFFEMIGGVFREVVYDNMRNVVTKFIGRNEKLINEDLIKLSLYYGFKINVTNCFSGNEKGHVEGSVKYIRSNTFAEKYKFNSFEEASEYLQNNLILLNKDKNIEEEKKHLLPIKPRFELGKKTKNKVSKLSFIRIENNFYSVPEYLTLKEVDVYNYIDKIQIYSNKQFVCEHKKIDGINKEVVDINHYLNTFTKKPGALNNSVALKSMPNIKNIYNNYFTLNSKKFIEILKKNQHCSIDELEKVLLIAVKNKEYLSIDYIHQDTENKVENDIMINITKNIKSISSFMIGGNKK